MIGKKRLALADAIGCLGHIYRLGILGIDVPVTMTDGPGNADICQPQDFVFLRVVIGLAVTGLAQARHAVDLILVRRTGEMLAITQQEDRVGLQAFGAVISQLFKPSRFVRQARININYRLNMLLNQ